MTKRGSRETEDQPPISLILTGHEIRLASVFLRKLMWTPGSRRVPVTCAYTFCLSTFARDAHNRYCPSFLKNQDICLFRYYASGLAHQQFPGGYYNRTCVWVALAWIDLGVGIWVHRVWWSVLRQTPLFNFSSIALQFPNDVYSVLFRGKIVLDGKDKATLSEVIALLCNLFTSSHCLP